MEWVFMNIYRLIDGYGKWDRIIENQLQVLFEISAKVIKENYYILHICNDLTNINDDRIQPITANVASVI